MQTAVIVATLVAFCTQGFASSQAATESWTTREISEVGLKFKLPPKYKEKRWGVTVGPIVGRRFYADLTFVDFEITQRTTFDRAKTHFQLDYSNYREWTDEIRGHKALIQTFQGGGSIISEKGAFPPFQVNVVCELDAKQFLSIRASCTSKDEQQKILAMVQTLEFSSNAKSQ